MQLLETFVTDTRATLERTKKLIEGLRLITVEAGAKGGLYEASNKWQRICESHMADLEEIADEAQAAVEAERRDQPASQ